MKQAKNQFFRVKPPNPYKDSEALYPYLYLLFGAYLMQDYDLSGNTLEEIIACYKSRELTAETSKAAIQEVDDFISRHPNDLDEHFEELYGFNFGPELWGYTTASFFEYLKTLLAK
ncbi:contact-dependent growth inhibition system immunity protein [Neisseriaceae bacterium TC5R-5]|nr:contact-dependent growth inhibition system immunity protein [Neisseriaceae bacterium TC5R-5]